MLTAAEAPANGTQSANKENAAEEPKQLSELAVLVAKVSRFFSGTATEVPATASWSAREVRSKIAELREELQNNFLEDPSGECQPLEQEPIKRRLQPNLELTLLEQLVSQLEQDELPSDPEFNVLQAQTHMARKRRKAMFKVQEHHRQMQRSFTVRNIFEAAGGSCEFQQSNCQKIEAVLNKHLRELFEAQRRRTSDPVFEFLAEKHGVTFDRHLSSYQDTFGYSNEMFRKVTKYRTRADVPQLGYNYSKVRVAYGGAAQQPFFEIQRRDVETEAENLETLDSYPNQPPSEPLRLPDDEVFRIEWIKQTKSIFKISRLGQKLKQERDGILKRLALSIVREVHNRYQKCEKTQRDYVGRAKRLHRQTQLYWRKREKELIEVKKKKEKLEAELRKREEEERESILQVRRLDFLLKESDIYAHFMAKKLGIEMEAPPEPAGGPRVEIDEQAAKLNISEMINEQKENLKKYDGPSKEKLDFSAVNQDSFTQLIQVPSSFRGTLKEYQLKGLRWLDNLYEQGINGILADEMGLGKTIQAIALLSHLSETKKVWGPFLVIAPSSTLFNWQQEIKKFCPSLKALPYWGTLKERKTIRKFFTEKKFTRTPDSPFHIVITSYQLAVSDEKTFHRLNWQYMILDEAQAIKNIGSQRWGILMGFKARNKLLLTGTPIQNTMAELWALLHFIMPKLFDSHELFQQWFSKDIEAHSQDQKALNQHQITRLHQILKPFMLRRVKKDVEHEIGKKIEHQTVCEMTRRQQHLYDSLKQKLNLKEFFRLFESKMKVENLMNLVMQFRKVCNHPELFERRPARSSFLLQNFYYYTGLQPARYGDAKNISFSSRNPILLKMSKLVYDEITCVEGKVQFAARLFDIFSSDNIAASLKGKLTAAGDQSEPIEPGEPIEGPLSNAYSFIPLMDLPVSTVQFASRQDPLYSYIILLHWYHHNRTSRSLSTKQNLLCLKETDWLHCLSYHAMNYNQFRTFIPVACAPPVDVEMASSRFSRYYELSRLNSFHSYLLYGRNKQAYEAPFVRSHSEAQQTLFQGITAFTKFNAIEVVDFASLIADSAKLKELDRILKEKKKNGDRVLIFCQMTKMLDILEDFMNKKKYSFFRLDGSLNIADRRDMVNEFQSNPKIFAFLLSTRAGGLGVTLTAANTVIFYDNDWNPTMDAQATDRAHRIGQRSDVNVYRLIAKGTIEERIVKRAQQKQTVQSTVYEGSFKADVFKPHEIIDLVFDQNEIEQDENQKLLNKHKMKQQRQKKMPTFIPGQPGRPRENREPEPQKPAAATTTQ